MFFGGSDEDDGSGFTVGMPSQGSGSRLSSLFGGGPSEGNESLMYRPQKQPSKPKEQQKQAPDAPSLLFATACHAYKFVNGQYASQGKLGAAVLGHYENKDYKILLYAAQKKPVTNAKLHQTFKFNVQKNNYATFYDDQSQNWSLCFDTADQLAEFSKWVGLSCYNVKPGSLMLQDLNFVDGQEVQKGDTVEMKYTGWLHAGNSFGKIFDSNEGTEKLFKFKIGKGKVIKGWDTGIVGMKKGSKRLLVIPPELAYAAKGAGERVPPNSTLIFQVQLTRVKFTNPQPDSDSVSMMSVDISSSTLSEQSKQPPPPTSSTSTPTKEEQETDDDGNESISKRTKSISEQLSKTPDTKTKLLERMSKMGQAMIPNPTRTVSQEDEIDQTDLQSEKVRTKSIERNLSNENNLPESPRPQIKPKPAEARNPDIPVPAPDYHYQQPPPTSQQPQSYQHHTQPYVYPGNMLIKQHPQDQIIPPQLQQQQLALYQSPQNLQSAMFSIPQHMQATPAPTPVSAPTSGVSSTELSLIMSEGKLQHSEVKSELTRLMDKLDNIQAKLVTMESLNNKQVVLPHGPEMEANVIMHNITRIIKENEKLSLECAEKGKKIEKLNESMTDLLTKNQSFFEKSNQLLASQSDSLQNNAAQAMAKVSLLEQKNVQLDSELSSTRTQLLLAQKKEESFEEKTVQMAVTIENLQKQLKIFKDKADTADSSTSENETMIEDLKNQIKLSKKEAKQLKMKLDQTEEEFSECKIESESSVKTLNDLKKKRKEDKTKHDEELEELKNQHEEELKNLKKRYSKNASGEAEKLSKLEEELTASFEQKMNSKMKSLEDKYNIQLEELRNEKDAVEEKLTMANKKEESLREELSKDYEGKLQGTLLETKQQHESQLDEVNRETTSLKEALHTLENKIKDGSTSDTKELEELRLKLDRIVLEKDKLQEHVTVLQQKNDSLNTRIDEMSSQAEQEQDAAYNRGVEEGRSTVKTISQASYDQGFKEGKGSVNTENKEAGVITTEVKKVMNSVFFKLKGEFELDEEYSGGDVVKTILNVVRDVTLKLTQSKEEENESESELSGEESEEEEEEENDEDIEEQDDNEGDELSVASTATPSHPSEEGVEEKVSDVGLDMTRQTSIDEVDDTVNKEEETMEVVNEVNEIGRISEDVNEKEPIEKNTLDEENAGQKFTKGEKENTDRLNGESSDDDDDASFTSAQSEPSAEDDSKIREEVDGNDSVTDKMETSDKPVLEQVGLDKSIFGSEETPSTSDALKEEEANKQVPSSLENKKDESELFFGASKNTKKEGINVEENASEEATTKKKSSSLFSEDDSDDNDDFFKPKDKTGATKTSAFNRSPPPLFEDDDDDTNWI